MAKSRSSEADRELYKRLSISRTDLGLMTRQLAVLLGSGLELRQSLEALSAGAGDENLRAVLLRILHCIDAGWNVSNSLKQFPRIFDQVYISMIEVGEETGTLSECLHGLANWLDSEEHLLRDVKSSLYYPVTVLVVAFILTVFFLTVIFPGFAESLSFGDKIPLPTRILMVTSSLLLSPLFWLGGLMAAGLLLKTVRTFLTHGENRARIYGVVLHLPVLGPVLRDVSCSRFCAAFGILQNSGVDVLKSFRLSMLASGSPQASLHVRDGVNTIVSGGKMSDYLRDHPEAFSRIMVDLIVVGEDAARLPETCLKLQELLEADARYNLEVLTSLLEPVLMVIISFVVGGLIICTALPMYNQIMNGL